MGDDATAQGRPPPEDGPEVGPAMERLQDVHGGRLARGLRHVDRALHALAGVTMVGLLLWTVVDILGRSLFSMPLRGTVELTELAVVILVYLGLARVENQDSHIAVDLLFGRLGTRGQLLLRGLAGLLGAGIMGLLTWRLFVFAGDLDAGGYATASWGLPLYPVALVGVVGSTAFVLALLLNAYVALAALVKRR
ncbi:TRAP transporter small permease [Egibacter rhizosphaerae]|uniref:TRAP transporter small permease n=1 Tax=Egibacter rhizosphaerae TaxID=1670831 RepID=A0A411YDW7_9ACTN|nr:TRAP transporter small permease [Egibacter rhizosphaerae]QBI19398.1 TRAP transporter small permease [Egibacter rhizosphaerae]